MSWTSLRDRFREWGTMALCALVSLVAFYLLIFDGASLSKVILLGVMLICPVVYLIAWLLGGGFSGAGRVVPVRGEADAGREQATWSRQRAPVALRPASNKRAQR